jgi:hypothetical protein
MTTDAFKQIAMAKDRLAVIEQRISELEPYSRFTAEQLVTMMQPLSQNRVSHRKQGTASLSYVEAHDIKNMLIRLFGFGGFDSEVIASDIKTGEWFVNEKSGKDNVKVLATATVRITLHPPARETAINFPPVRYAETAASSQTGADEGDTADFAVKTAESDAFKRAAIFLGSQFGLSLYANGSRDDQVVMIFEPTQKELLALGRERGRINGFLAASAPGSAPQNGGGSPSATPAPSGAPAGNVASLQGALNDRSA